ncbi:S41 family peptidase [Edaphocola aurantiacus]|uniref:S41 family peptidase n=1 Tax=Edaphocola aurantiacus TaxID=2601682 RepID=UPI001C95438F|nr:S41 family peptidase [Edaphocola aurantiacus]
MYKIFTLLSFTLLFGACKSVERNNRLRNTAISVHKLQKDINFVEKKLIKKHPNYDWYTSKEAMAYKFDSLRKVVNHRMTPNEFFLAISPVVASVHQGHMTMLPLAKKYTRKEAKAMNEAGKGPVSQFDYFWEQGKLYVLNNHSIHKEIKRGAEVLAIKGVWTKALYEKYRNTFTSDGYNQTFIRKIFARRFPVYLIEEIGVNDSLPFVMRQGDSTFTTMVHRLKDTTAEEEIPKKEKQKIAKTTVSPVVKDSVAQQDSVAKATALAKKETEKQEERNQNVYGYDKETKKYTRSLSFAGKDSAVAIVTIRQFMGGQFRKAYAEIFDSIRKQDCSTLILDIRDNPGGSAKEIVKLYEYLADTNFTFYRPTQVVSKTSMLRAGLFQRVPKFAYPFMALFYPFYAGDRFFGTRKDDGKYYYHNLYGTDENKPRANAFKGKIYVLINGGCFSAACLLSSELKALPNVTFVGEETGGDFNGTVAGVMPLFRLPHSRLPWRMGLMHIRPENETEVKGRGIFPDKEIIPSYEDKKNDKDPEMDWVMKQIEPQPQLQP